MPVVADLKKPAVAKVSAERYLTKDFHQKEKNSLWPKVWQVACREEQIPNPGDYIVYDIADDSIVVVKTRDNTYNAFHNVCPHRGRQIMEGRGHAVNFRCSYHGWTFDLNGRNVVVQDKEDWDGTLDCEAIDLHRVQVGTWGGFVWINMNKDCEPLLDYLHPVPEFLDPYELENLRFRWAVELKIPCNWKVAMEAFMEGYHVAATHPQLLRVGGDDYTTSMPMGKHARFSYRIGQAGLGRPSPRLKATPAADCRPGVLEFFSQMEETFGGVFTDRDYEAAKGIFDVVPADAGPDLAFAAAVELGRKAAEADGCGYPPRLSFEVMAKAGADWHVFPNCVTLPYFDGAAWYRARPNGNDPESCLFDIWSLKRYAAGKEPKAEVQQHDSIDGKSFGLILDQDLSNLAKVQKGMRSRAFTYGRPNPVQEGEIINFHKTLDQYLQNDM